MYKEKFSLELQEYSFLHCVTLELEFLQVSLFHGCLYHLKEVSQGSQAGGGRNEKNRGQSFKVQKLKMTQPGSKYH